MKRFLAALLFLGVNYYSFSQTASEVTIPLTEYLKLIEKEKSEPMTVIEEVTLKGDYQSSKFVITFKGQAVAPWKKEAVLTSFEGHLRSCTGNGLVSFENGNYQILPQKNTFQITCALQPKNKNLRLYVLNALFFDSQVSNAEVNLNEDNTDRRMITLLEKSKETEQRPRADVIAKARYKLSILPDTSKFEYQFTLNNPNRLSEKYTINLGNGEVIESVSTTLKYQEGSSALSFNIPTGEHYVFVKGKIAGQSFKPLLKSEEQYLLIQNHPLMQVQPTTNWRRIATQESSIQQEYNSARAFLIDPRESLSWSAKKLEVYSALGYTLKSAHYLYYVPRNGKAVVEATYQVNNQGTPEIALAVPGKALFMSVDNQALPLYKDDKGNLLIGMTSGEHSVVVQYQPELPERFLASYNRDTLAKPQAVITEASLNIRHDSAWRMLAGRFGEDFTSHLHLRDFVWAFLFGFLSFMLLKRLYLVHSQKTLYAIAIPAGLLTFLGSFYTAVLFMTLVSLCVWRFREWIFAQLAKAKNMSFSYKKIATALAVVVVLTFAANSLMRNFLNTAGVNYPSAGYATSRNLGGAYDSVASSAPTAPAMEENIDVAKNEGGSFMGQMLNKGKQIFGGGGGMKEDKAQAQQESYEGLPARIEIPSSGRNEYFNLSLVDADRELKTSSLFVKDYFFMFFDFLILAALAFAVHRNKKTLKEALSRKYT